jgi:predicted nucleic acid-binding protein
MPEKWVVNASPLISLARLNQTSLLFELCDEMVIPSGVAGEINQGTDDDPAKLWFHKSGMDRVKDVGMISPVIAAWDLGRGESEVINWAYNYPSYETILDDRAARNCALSLNIRVRGTIGVILLAKQRQKIKRVKPLLNQLIQNGFRIDPELIKTAIELAGENE